MDINNSGLAARKLSIKLMLALGFLGLSLVSNAALAVVAATSQKVVLVPTLTDTVEVGSGGAVDRDYLERMSRDAIYLFLNRTPETARYFEAQLERIVDPATYQEIKTALIKDRQDRRETKSSQTFFPSEFYVKPGDLYVEVVGRLQLSDGVSIQSTETKTYALRFARHGTAVRLKSIVEMEAKDRLGARAKAQTEADR
ncbi:TraE/TraK family type IV conjugative transfer system protein [Caulobacter sp. 17J65-9]|uniref:TraE/TraK family type IV conjugative transfer system protein n=1 Tax=Caulobacter sp. 17J65-9 TaxID=2709382 RepID=UPI0013C71977|nr:TraE/TraK family type IV conjugative transfer system protein [Caulobacter sp. 17J65-9]NEX91219.1 traE family protein [Caulobacter sp. 17J65-9]